MAKPKITDTSGISPVVDNSYRARFFMDPKYMRGQGSYSDYTSSGMLGLSNSSKDFLLSQSEEYLGPDSPNLEDIMLIENTTYKNELGQTRSKLVFQVKNSSRNGAVNVAYQISLSLMQGGSQ